MLQRIAFKIILIGFLLSPTYTQQTSGQHKNISKSKSSVQQRVSVLTALLVQNNPIAELATFQENRTLYARQPNFWGVGSTGLGFSLGFAYDVQNSQGVLFRMQTFLESTGWVMGTLDLGTGIRIPIGQKGINFSTEFYFSMALSGGKLDVVGIDITDQPSSLSSVVGFFGFKGRLALEIPIAKNSAITPYISYVAYPWHSASTSSDYSVNGNFNGVTLDGLQIGLEFTWKI
ncbi:MAG: hypothetical protein ACRCWI_04010 [Brevinema sp.]